MEEFELVYHGGGVLLEDSLRIIDEAKQQAYRSINIAMLKRNWMLGKRIREEILKGEDRAEYGEQIIQNLSKDLTRERGKGFNKNNLYAFVQFYKIFPTLSGKSELLTWSHYVALMTIDSDKARDWYAHEAYAEMWSVRTLQRNIASQYYNRILKSHNKEAVHNEMIQLTESMQGDKLEFVKNPVVAEFLGFAQNSDFTESELEKSIITHLQNFMMEMGKGYAFVARQQHIRTDMGDFYIDLVFYNYILKCFFLIDLKTSQISHQDVGQMDMYVRMYDDLKRTKGDNPTIGLILCSQTSRDIARYSILSESRQIFQAKYLTYLPSEDELRNEIERQKEIFYLQHSNHS